LSNEAMTEKARELGRILGQGEEYKALERARQRAMNDRELTAALNRLGELEKEIGGQLRAGNEPSPQQQEEYETLFGQLQSSSIYQGLVAAQSNFDKVLGRVNQNISEGIESGSKSRIILPT
jgi:cell fate (sporulation/competence/biofilm development) regulator YlbF (YheA/YmcA/DUF963 family)